jgi:hypothetical protein
MIAAAKAVIQLYLTTHNHYYLSLPMDLPRGYSTRNETLASLKDYEYAVEEEFENSKTRKFWAGPHDSLFYMILNNPNGRYHEFIFADRPVKLCFDLEKDTKVLSPKEFEEEVYKILMELPEDRYGTPVLLDCSREVKNSMHIVYPRTVFRNLKELDTFVRTKFLNNPVIDYNIYSRPGTLRMAFSTSCSAQPHRLVPFGGSHEFNMEILKLCTLHYYELAFFWNNLDKTKTKSAFALPSDKLLSKYQELLFKWAFFKNYNISGYKENMDTKVIQFYVRGMKCPKKNAPHKSNSLSFTIDLSNIQYPSIIRCLDADCKDVHCEGPLFSTIFRMAEMTKEIAAAIV